MSHLASVVPVDWEDNTEGRLGGGTTSGSVLDVGGIGGDLRLEGDDMISKDFEGFRRKITCIYLG